MLETIKHTIEQLPDIDFHTFYTAYMLTVQDTNIAAEFKHLINKNLLGVSTMDLLIKNTFEELKKL